MARIRTIKPEFPQSESMGNVSRDARLCFILLWTIADDSGRLRGNSRMLASLLFPYDNDASGLIDGWISELEREGCITRYMVEGSTYIEIAKWLSHQKIDKPSQSKFPPFAESSRILANPRERSPLDQGPRTKEGIKERTEDQGQSSPDGSSLQGFEKFWEQWPKTKRKGGKSQCLAKWKREGYEAIADQIIKHMMAMKQSPDWLKQDGEFVPMPSTYLNQKRWEGSEIAGTTQPEAEFEFWTVAGFATKYDATNNSCYLHNYQEFENGKRCHRKLTEQDLDQIRRGMRVLDKPHEYDLPDDIKRMYKL